MKTAEAPLTITLDKTGKVQLKLFGIDGFENKSPVTRTVAEFIEGITRSKLNTFWSAKISQLCTLYAEPYSAFTNKILSYDYYIATQRIRCCNVYPNSFQNKSCKRCNGYRIPN